MRIEEIMSKPVCCVEPDTPLAEAVTLMGEQGVGSTLVMDGSALLGILTERDIVRALSNDFDAAHGLVREWMTPRPITIPVDAEHDDALALMLANGFRHLPVVDGDEVVGVVSMRDLARAVTEEE